MIRQLLSSNTTIYAVIATMLGLLFLKNGLEINIPVSLILLVSIIPAFFATPSQIIAMGLAFIPLSAGFQFKYALMAYVIVGIVRYGREMHLSKLTMPIVLMALWEMTHVLVGDFSINEFLRNFAELIFLWFVSCLNLKNINMKVIARALSIAVIGVCSIVMYMQTNMVMGDVTEVLAQREDGEYRFGDGNTEDEEQAYGLNFNPNGLGFMCNLSVIGLLILLLMRKANLFDTCLIIASITFGMFTLSRSFLLCLAFILLGFIFLSPIASKQRLKYTLILLGVVPLALWLIVSISPDVFTNFSARFQVDDVTNGRSTLLAFYTDHIFSSAQYCFYGIGVQNFGEKIMAIYGHNAVVCHNGFQEIWVAWGLPGVLMFLYFLYSIIQESHRWNKKHVLFAYIPILFVLLYSMAGQLIRSQNSLLALAICLVSFCIPWHQYRYNNQNR